MQSGYFQKFLSHLHLICPSVQLSLVNRTGILRRDHRSILARHPQLSLAGFHVLGPLLRYSFHFISLRTLFLSWLSFSPSNPLFSIVCRLFRKNTRGVGVPRRHTAAACHHFGPPFAPHALTNPFFRKSFIFTFIQNDRVSVTPPTTPFWLAGARMKPCPDQ
jgi:hypothetical protein